MCITEVSNRQKQPPVADDASVWVSRNMIKTLVRVLFMNDKNNPNVNEVIYRSYAIMDKLPKRVCSQSVERDEYKYDISFLPNLM